MKHLLASVCTLLSLVSFAQQKHFIYIQSDNQQPFYVKLDKKIMSSSASGYIIIPKLLEGAYDFTIGFPKNEWPEQKVTCNVATADAGYLLKNFGEKGWGLFNFQTLDLLMANNNSKKDSSLVAEVKTDPFATALSNVVNDPSLAEVKNETPVVKEETKKPAAQPVAKVVRTKEASVTKKETIEKIMDNHGADSASMVYVSRGKGRNDTIDVVIPAYVEPVKPVTETPVAVATDTKQIEAAADTNATVAAVFADTTHTTIVEEKTVASTTPVSTEIKPDIKEDKTEPIAKEKANNNQPGKKTKKKEKIAKQQPVKEEPVETRPVATSTTTESPVTQTIIPTADTATATAPATATTPAPATATAPATASATPVDTTVLNTATDNRVVIKTESNEKVQSGDSIHVVQFEIKPVPAQTDSTVAVVKEPTTQETKPVLMADTAVAQPATQPVQNNENMVVAETQKKVPELITDTIKVNNQPVVQMNTVDSVAILKQAYDSLQRAMVHMADSLAAVAKQKAEADSIATLMARQKVEADAAAALLVRQKAEADSIAASLVKQKAEADSIAAAQKALAKTTVPVTPKPVTENPVNNASGNTNKSAPRPAVACKQYVDDDEYLSLRKKMDKSKDNETEMLYLAHKVFEKRCFNTRQIQRLSLLFATDAGKYKLFDDAYQYTYDAENFPSLESELSDEYYKKRFRVMLR